MLGTLIEKAQTTPAQYPLTLNSLQTGCNQKNNREPVTSLTEERVFDAIDSLRAKGLAREAMLSGSRVSKFRHVTREVLSVSTEELVLLAELWLRGPQTLGELRGNASRMHPLESVDAVKALLEGLKARPEPYVKEISPRAGERATRYTQLFCPELHPLDAATSHSPGQRAPTLEESPVHDLDERIARLENELAELKICVAKLTAALGG